MLQPVDTEGANSPAASVAKEDTPGCPRSRRADLSHTGRTRVAAKAHVSRCPALAASVLGTRLCFPPRLPGPRISPNLGKGFRDWKTNKINGHYRVCDFRAYPGDKGPHTVGTSSLFRTIIWGKESAIARWDQ